MESPYVLEGPQGLLKKSPAPVPDEFLGKVAHGGEPRPVENPRVGLHLCHDDLHQRRLARPVGSDDGDPVALADEQRQVFEKDLRAVLLGDVVN